MTTYLHKKNRIAAVVIAQAATIFVALNAYGQTAPQAADASLKPVTVTSPTVKKQADVTGFGDVPAERQPISTTVISSDAINAVGARRLADVLKLDASVSDAYNAPGYWDFATVRGFVLDNKFNYRREGLPVSAETFIPLDNKERVEILKGTSGIQAGTSAPGGLINYAVKRPTNEALRTIKLEATSAGSALAAADLGGRFGIENAFGYRFNVAIEKLKFAAPATQGKRDLASLALDMRIGKDSLLEAEVEYSRRSQPSVPGLSLLGTTLPAADPKLNLSNQPWALPVVLQGVTGSMRFEQALSTDWRWSAQWGTQRLKSDDRSAFPFGCGNGGTGTCNAYYSNGDVDIYDFRSENERRTTNAGQLQLKGKLQTGGIQHDLGLGLLRSSYRERGQAGAYNFAGTSNVFNPIVVTPDPTLTTDYTNRDIRSTELSITDGIQWTPAISTWLGLRHTTLASSSYNTTIATDYKQSFNTPWAAVAYQLSPATLLYASHGQGIESKVTPNNPALYGAQAGQPLPSLRSRQNELGIKSNNAGIQWSLAWFDIARPLAVDTGSSVRFDGQQRHSGVEATAQVTTSAWQLGGGVTALNAKVQDATVNIQLNGQRPTNVPAFIARLNAGYRFADVPGLSATTHVSHEGARNVLPDGSAMLPAWTRVDAGLTYATKLAGAQTTWSLGIDNLFNRQFFKESPYQFGHVYLFPQQPRTLRLSLNASL